MDAFVQALRLIPALVLQPSAWRSCLYAIDPALSPHFCLAELEPRQWRNPRLVRLLLQMYLICLCLLAPAMLVVMAAAGRPNALLGVALLFSLLMSLVFATLASTAVGIAVLAVSGLALSWAWARPDALTIDMIFGARFAVLFGLTSAAAIHVTDTLGRHAAARTAPAGVRTGQARGILIGAGLGVLVAALVVGLVNGIIGGREGGMLQGQWTRLTVAGVATLLFVLAVWWHTRHWLAGLVAGMCLFAAVFVLFGATGADFGRDPGGRAFLQSTSLVIVLVFLVLFAIPFALVARLAGIWAGVIAGSLGGLLVYPAIWSAIRIYAVWPNLAIGAVLLLLGVTAGWWRPLLFYPLELLWNLLLQQLDEQRSARQAPPGSTKFSCRYLAWNAAFWDEQQYLPLRGLDAHLVLAAAGDEQQGAAAIQRAGAGRQRWAAQAAQIELDCRKLEQCATVADIAAAHAAYSATGLAGPASAFFQTLRMRSGDVAAALRQVGIYNQRLAMAGVAEDLNLLQHELLRSSEGYARRFQPLVARWRQIVAGYLQELEAEVEQRGEIPNPYVVGIPLVRQQELFVGRTAVVAQIEALLREQDQPPLLLYGQRRMGKTSLLRQLRRLLPQRIVPFFVDLQGPVAQSLSHASFLYNLAKHMSGAAQENGLPLAPLARDELAPDPFTVFDDWLDRLDSLLAEYNRSTALIVLDEFEVLDSAFRQGTLSAEAVLGTLRHIVQHRPRFRLLLAGSHTLDEFRHWSSYLINAQVIHLGYLQEGEARQLIERPIPDFPVIYAANASQHVLALTRGHPYLVQLLCSELVMLKNLQEPPQRFHVTCEDVEAAVPEVLERGSQFFADIELHQADTAGRAVLQRLAGEPAGEWMARAQLASHFPDDETLRAALQGLLQRELIEEAHGAYRVQVELIRRWFLRRRSE